MTSQKDKRITVVAFRSVTGSPSILLHSSIWPANNYRFQTRLMPRGQSFFLRAAVPDAPVEVGGEI